jgi:NADH-quinone oxidoreductase subunit D
MSLAGFEVEVQREGGNGLVCEDMTLSMGPQHPSTHGVLRFVVRADGEVMREAIPDIGYLHRSIEKIAEKVGWHGFMPYTDRVDYVAAMFCNHGWAMAAETLAKIEVPRRAEFCRVIADELCRLHSHLLAAGSTAMDLGAFTPFTHAIRERENLNDLFEELCGSRLTFHYMRIGGVGWDIPPGWSDKVLHFLDRFEPMLEEYDRLITNNKIFAERLANIAVVSPQDAIAWNLVGPNLRGSGVRYDVRKDDPYSVYGELDFDVPVGVGQCGTVGDAFDRYVVRLREMRESCRIIRQCLEKIPDGPAGCCWPTWLR